MTVTASLTGAHRKSRASAGSGPARLWRAWSLHRFHARARAVLSMLPAAHREGLARTCPCPCRALPPDGTMTKPASDGSKAQEPYAPRGRQESPRQAQASHWEERVGSHLGVSSQPLTKPGNPSWAQRRTLGSWGSCLRSRWPWSQVDPDGVELAWILRRPVAKQGSHRVTSTPWPGELPPWGTSAGQWLCRTQVKEPQVPDAPP